MKNWVIRQNAADFVGMAKQLNIDPIAVRIMVNRGMSSIDQMREFLKDDITSCFEYKGLPYINEAVETIEYAKKMNLKTRIIGDYDADGVMATAILMKGLKAYGLLVDFVIPNRITEGYGINVNIVDKAHEDNVGLIVTCDNGISAREAIDKAFDYGMKVVVTDHHTLYEEAVPTKWNALVNPKCPNNEYPFQDICGAMVAFKLLCALFDNNSEFEQLKLELLEMASIATQTDIMPLINENRWALRWALPRLYNAINPGLRQLVIKVKEGKGSTVSVGDIGFKIGPCINATGRIDVADRAVNLFITDDDNLRTQIVDELYNINQERKEITEKCMETAKEEIEKLLSVKGKLDDIIVLYLEDCHVSICGLVAGKIREKYYRPAIVVTDSVAGLTGSGRSIDDYNMIDNLQKCAQFLSKFGGHKAACGLSLEKEQLESFREAINRQSNLTEEELTEKIRIDVNMPFGYITENTIESINRLEPFGNGNETPVFALKDLLLIRGSKKGTDGNHLFITILDSNNKYRSLKLWWGAEDFEYFLRQKISEDRINDFYKYEGKGIMDLNIRLTVSYMPVINEFNGRRDIDFILKEYKYS